MRHIAQLLACVIVLTTGCRRAPRAGAVGEAPPPLAAPPDDLMAVMVLPHPDATWQALRAVTGGSGLMLTPDLAPWVGGLLELPPLAVEQLDTSAPILGAVTRVHDALELILAVRLKDGARMIELATAPGAPFTTRQQPGQPVVELTRGNLTGEKTAGLELAVADNYLLLARNFDAVRTAIAFVTSNLAAQTPPAEDLVVTLPHRALSGQVRDGLERWWTAWRRDREAQDVAMRQAHGGSAPDFGDPAQALADIDARAKHFWELLVDLREASLRITMARAPELPNLHIELLASAESPTGPMATELAALAAGDGEQLLQLPGTLAAAVLVYDDRQARREAASAKASSLAKVLGGRLEPLDQSKIDAALTGWANGRGDWLTVGMLADNGRRTGVWRSAVSDRQELQRALVGVLHLLEVRAIADPIAAWVGELTLSGLGDPGAPGALQTVHVVRRPPKLRRRSADPPATPSAFDVVWSVGEEIATGAVGDDARAAHDTLLRRSTRTLRDNARLVALLARRGPGTSLAAFVDLGRLGLARDDGATVVLSCGKPRGAPQGQASLTLDLPPRLLLDRASALSQLLPR